ncbi:EamA family transporter [Allorhizocola rhizosphaerae]|uniref:EamA family transporter n=1 Tax=Allorhizocola rhizosphaerae TaxID=1872709 RepID=UPI000E3DB0FA|nr:DMT family transporter [Allorhizocola rhizosphaerae]
MRQRNGMGAGLGLALLSSASFGTSGSFARSLTDAGWSSGAAVAARVGVAALILAIPAAIAMRGRWGALWRSLGTVSGYGLIAVAGCQVAFFNAVQTLSVGVALLLEYLGLILVVGWMWLRHGQRPRRLTVAGSVVAVAGLAFMLDLAGETRLDLTGVLWGLGAAFGLATYFVLSSKVDSELPPVTFASAGMSIGAIALLAAGALGALPMHATTATVDFAGQRVHWLVPIIGLSLVAAAVAYVAGIGAARRLGARLASFVGLTEVAFAVLFAWLMLGQLPTWMQFAGGALIVAGVVLVRMDERAEGEPAPAAKPAATDQPALSTVS